MKKVILYWPRWYPFIGGITTHIHEIVDNMPDIEFKIITNSIVNENKLEKFNENTLVKRVSPNDLILSHPKWEKLPKILYPYVYISDVARIKKKMKLIKSTKHDILHVHGPSVEPDLLFLDDKTHTRFFSSLVDFSFDENIKILTCHGLASHYSSDPKVLWREKRLIQMFDKIICVDEYVYTGIKYKMGLDIDAEFIPNSVNTELFSFKAMTFSKKLNVGFVGRYTDERGTSLIEQLIFNLPNYIHLDLIIAGSENKIQALKEIIRNKDITLHLNILPKDLPELLWKINILLNPVTYEGISRATLESFSCGRPVIMLDVGNRKPVVNNETGFLINNDIKELLALLELLQNNKKILEDMSTKVRKTIEKEYSNEVIMPRLRKIYDSVRGR